MLSVMLLVTIVGGAQAPAAPSGTPTIKDVAWIAGCWDSTRNGRHVAEHWMAPEGGTMMGVSRTTSGDKTTEWEFLIIRQGSQGLDYVAKPSRQPEATFTAARASANEVVFENPAHDFPKRIIYKRDGDSLMASIEGPMNGQNRRIDFPYKKASCGGS
jgi:hypothetical protein